MNALQPPVREWRIHLGVHGSASQPLQPMLAASRESLLSQGVDVLPAEGLRNLDLTGLRRALARDGAEAPIQKLALESRLSSLRAGPDTVVASLDDFMGRACDLLATPIYPRAAAAVAFLAVLARGGTRLSLFLAARSCGELLAVAYAQALVVRPMAEGFDGVKARMIASPRPWANLVRRIQRACPQADLRVWADDARTSRAAEAASLIAGLSVANDGGAAAPALPTAEGVALAEGVTLRSGPERTAQVLQIYREHAAPHPDASFNPLDEGERQMLRARHERDLAEVEACRAGTLVRWA